VIIINGDGGCSFWQPVQADSQLGAVLHSSNEPGELSQWLCHNDSTINIVSVIIIIIIITENTPPPRYAVAAQVVTTNAHATRSTLYSFEVERRCIRRPNRGFPSQGGVLWENFWEDLTPPSIIICTYLYPAIGRNFRHICHSSASLSRQIRSR